VDSFTVVSSFLTLALPIFLAGGGTAAVMGAGAGVLIFFLLFLEVMFL